MPGRDAKNIALLHRAPGRIELSPAYDTVPTGLWPKLGTTAALSECACLDLPSVTLDDLVAEASRWGLSARTARARASGVLDALRGAAVELAGRTDGAVLAAVLAAVGARVDELTAR